MISCPATFTQVRKREGNSFQAGPKIARGNRDKLMPLDAAAHHLKRSPSDIRSDIMQLVEEYCQVVHRQQPFKPGTSSVPVSGRVFDSSDVKSLIDSGLDFWLTTGRFNEQFEKNLAARVGSRYALTVNSGSSANLVAFSALTSPLMRDRQIQPDSEIITAAAGFPTTVNPSMMW